MSSPLHRHPAMDPPASHLDLLAMGHRIRDAAVSDDAERLHAELARLRTALVDHVHAEQGQLGTIPHGAAELVRDGQRRLLHLLSDVLFGTADTADGGCTCLVRAAEIEVALRRQAKLEANLFRRHPRTGR